MWKIFSHWFRWWFQTLRTSSWFGPSRTVTIFLFCLQDFLCHKCLTFHLRISKLIFSIMVFGVVVSLKTKNNRKNEFSESWQQTSEHGPKSESKASKNVSFWKTSNSKSIVFVFSATTFSVSFSELLRFYTRTTIL